MDLVNAFIDFSTNFIAAGGYFFGFLLIILESILPVLPLGVFVALNVNAFGVVMGTFISWLATCVGCFLSYLLFYKLSNKYIYRFFSKDRRKKLQKARDRINNISFSKLVLIVALPFTPAFLVNIICGLAEVSRRKFLASIIIGKVFIIIFWGYIGKSFIESMTDIKTIITLSSMLLVAYIVSKIVSKKMNIE